MLSARENSVRNLVYLIVLEVYRVNINKLRGPSRRVCRKVVAGECDAAQLVEAG